MSVIEIPEGSLFGLDNLPFGIFAAGGAAPRAGVRVADSVIDLAVDSSSVTCSVTGPK